MMSQREQFDLNQATEEQLARLPGIGPTLAERIVAYRQETGSFEAVGDLSLVEGISGAMVRDIAELLYIEEADPQGSDQAETADDSNDSETGIDESAPDDGPDPEEDAAAREPQAETGFSDEEDVAALADEIRIVDDDEARVQTLSIASEELPAVGEAEDDPAEEHEAAAVQANDSGQQLSSKYSGANHRHDSSAASPVTAASPSAAQAQQRGCSLQAAVIGTSFGALIGAVLAMVAIYFLNGGTLQFSSQHDIDETSRDLQAQMETYQADQGALSGRIDEMQESLDQLSEEAASMATQQAEMKASFEQTGELVAGYETEVSTLEERIGTIFIAAEDFNSFVDGLRHLLVDIEATREAGTVDPIEESSDSDSSPISPSIPTATPQPTPSSPPATRTPRPTFTPLGTAEAASTSGPEATSRP